MRVSTIRLIGFAASVLFVLSCADNATTGTFAGGGGGGNGGGGGGTPTGTDTVRPFTIIDTPTVGQLLNAGDSVLVVTRIHDDRSLAGVQITGFKITGDPNLGNLERHVRFLATGSPVSGETFPSGLTDTTIRRFLHPATPVDTTPDSNTVILAITTDASGNVDTASIRVNIVTGPRVTLVTPVPLDSVPQGVAMAISVHVTQKDGIDSVKVRVQGDTGFTGIKRLDTLLVRKFTGTQTDVVFDTSVVVPDSAPLRGRITISASAVDQNRNPGAATPTVVIVRAQGTTIPRVTQIVQPRLETADSITVKATGDGIEYVGYVMKDLNGVLVKRDSVHLTAPFKSNARRGVQLNLAPAHQGKTVRVSTFAVDQSGVRGYSVRDLVTSVAQSDSTLAFSDEAIVVFGRTFPLPRAGVVGDIAVDEARGHVFVSNLSFNRLEIFDAAIDSFYAPGIAVGSQPWGLNRTATSNDSLLVANSGGTNLSKVFIGSANAANMHEDIQNRIRTRISPMFEVLESVNGSTGRVTITVKDPLLFSDRPQYVGQITDNAGYNPIFFSTRPTTEATKGLIHWFDPGQAAPDLRSIITYTQSDASNFLVMDVDSVFIFPSSKQSSEPDTIVICDHQPGTLNASQCAQRPSATSTAFGVGAAVAAIQALVNSDVTAIPNINTSSIGMTDTTFISVSGDRNWIGFGAGNTSGAGNIFLASATPRFFSPIFSQRDLTNNAAEHVFGLAMDSTGVMVAAHGAESYFASVDAPFHLRLQGKYSTFATGAGIAFHPAERGLSTPSTERKNFVASDNLSVEVLDVAHFLSAGSLPTKGKLYGPLRVTRRFPSDPAAVVLKLYGVTTEGLVVIDVRNANLTPVPVRAP